MANQRSSPHTSSGYNTAVWAAKVALCFIGILSFCVAARTTFPAASEVLDSVLPGFRAALRSWLAPPYLFIAVHLIILVIWKLSDQKQHLHCENWAADESMAELAIKSKPSEPSSSDGFLRKTASSEILLEKMSKSPKPAPSEHSPSEASCVTTESPEMSTASSAFVNKKSNELDFKDSIAAEEEDDEAAAVAAATAAARLENDSMEVTWKAIMEKSTRPAATLGRNARQPAAEVPSSASHDELNRRFDDFIRKNHEQIRLLNGQRRRHQGFVPTTTNDATLSSS